MDCCARYISVAESFEDVVEQTGNVFVRGRDDVDPGCENDCGGCEAVFNCRDGNFRSF